MSNLSRSNELSSLTLQAIEGTISDDDFFRLEEILNADPSHCDTYAELNILYSMLRKPDSLFDYYTNDEICPFDSAAWRALMEEEKTAPAAVIPQEKVKKEFIPGTSDFSKRKRSVSKFSIAVFALSATAMILMLLYVRIAPQPACDIAMIADSIGADWARSEYSTDIGGVLRDNEGSRWLNKGIVKVKFEYGAEVIIEGPAEFELKAEDEMILYSGRLFAHVPERAGGFTVQTPYSTVIDLGTEFGVKVDYNGSTDVHLYKGRASLIPGAKGRSKLSHMLEAGQAKSVNKFAKVKSIDIEKNAFARKVSSKDNFVWKGEDISIADIVGGGNGFGNGQPESAIDPLNGRVLKWNISNDRQGSNRYVPVTGREGIDGIFVPDGSFGPVEVTSAGHQWDAPDTTNFFKYNIANSVHIPDNPNQYQYFSHTPKSDQMIQMAVKRNVPVHLMELNVMDDMSVTADTNILMHSNLGITFDLNEIRKNFPDTSITKFKSVFGISESFYELEGVGPEAMHVDMWVLVDGEPELFKQEIDGTMVVDIEIELSETDRFLTLVVTDSTDNDDINSYSFDWGLFINPRLEVD